MLAAAGAAGAVEAVGAVGVAGAVGPVDPVGASWRSELRAVGASGCRSDGAVGAVGASGRSERWSDGAVGAAFSADKRGAATLAFAPIPIYCMNTQYTEMPHATRHHQRQGQSFQPRFTVSGVLTRIQSRLGVAGTGARRPAYRAGPSRRPPCFAYCTAGSAAHPTG